MQLLLIHDHKFRRINGEYYSTGCFSDSVLSWYQNIFGEVSVIGRVVVEDRVGNNYSKIVNPNVKIFDKSNIKEMVKNSEAIIARLPSINGYIGLHYARKYKKKYFVEIVGCVLDAYWYYSLIGKLLAFPAYLVMKYNVKKADYALYVTNVFLQKRYPNSNVCLSATDAQITQRDQELLLSRKTISNKNKIIIGTAAPLDVNYKGQKYVIKALKYLKKKHIRVEYHLAGNGDKSRLLKLANKYNVNEMVVFDGLVKKDNMDEWYGSLDVYVHPSLLEGMSRAILEAMSNCLPCIAINCGGNTEIIHRTLLVNKHSNKPKCIAKLVESLLNDQYYFQMCLYSYENIKNNFDYEKVTLKRVEFYSDFSKKISELQ